MTTITTLNRKQELETELQNLERLAEMFDKFTNVIQRTPDELKMRYGWSERMIAICKELREIRESKYK